MAFIGAITVSAIVIPRNGHSPGLVVAGTMLYLCGFAAHSVVGRRGQFADESLRYTGDGLAQIVDDLRAESDELDALVAPLAADRWERRRPPWVGRSPTRSDTCVWTDRGSLTSVTDEAAFAGLLEIAAADPIGFVNAGGRRTGRHAARRAAGRLAGHPHAAARYAADSSRRTQTAGGSGRR